MAHLTVFHLMLHGADSIGQFHHIFRILTQQVQHQTQSGLTSDAWQFGKLLNSLF
jgi:hypothetical protein